MSQRACHVYIQVTNEINVFSHFHDANNAKKRMFSSCLITFMLPRKKKFTFGGLFKMFSTFQS